jgi:hypothetical protein
MAKKFDDACGIARINVSNQRKQRRDIQGTVDSLIGKKPFTKFLKP